MQDSSTGPFLFGMDGPGTPHNIKYKEALKTPGCFMPCGLQTTGKMTVLVILCPETGHLAETYDFCGERATQEWELQNRLGRLFHRFPWPLACAVDRHTINMYEDLRGDVPCRFVIYEDGPASKYYKKAVKPFGTGGHALALARHLWQDLRDIQTFHQEMLWLSLMGESVQRLQDILKQRLPFALRSELPSFGETHASAEPPAH